MVYDAVSDQSHLPMTLNLSLGEWAGSGSMNGLIRPSPAHRLPEPPDWAPDDPIALQCCAYLEKRASAASTVASQSLSLGVEPSAQCEFQDAPQGYWSIGLRRRRECRRHTRVLWANS